MSEDQIFWLFRKSGFREYYNPIAGGDMVQETLPGGLGGYDQDGKKYIKLSWIEMNNV